MVEHLILFKKLFPPIHPTIKALICRLPSDSSLECEQAEFFTVRIDAFKLEFGFFMSGLSFIKLFSEDTKQYIPLNDREERALRKAVSKLNREFWENSDKRARAVLD